LFLITVTPIEILLMDDALL